MSSPPKFRTSRSTAHPGVTLYTLPTSSSIERDKSYTTLRRTTRSSIIGSSSTVKTEPSEPSGESSMPISAAPNTTTPSKRTRNRPIPTVPSPSTPKLKRPRPSNPTTPSSHPHTESKPNLTPTPSKKTPKKPLPLAPLEKAHKAPERWEIQYRIIERMRAKIVAPVDTMGCERPDLPDLSTPNLPVLPTQTADLDVTIPLNTPHLPPLPTTTPTLPSKTQRFHTLISLMLSSQTKDAITASAINNLHSTLPGGLTCSALAEAERGFVEGCICKVGFWRRKAEYIQAAARDLLDRTWEKGDVPRTIEGLCRLKGVGPKMAFLALQCAWNINAGIGVDVHVHRITNRLKWHRPPTITAEQTRVNLESWLPKELHKGINPMLVGFGQTICLPVGPRCDLCLLGTLRLCPSRISNVRTAGRKAVEWKFDIADIEDLLPIMSKEAEVKEEEGVEGLVKLEETDEVEVRERQSVVQGVEEVSVTVKVEDV